MTLTARCNDIKTITQPGKSAADLSQMTHATNTHLDHSRIGGNKDGNNHIAYNTAGRKKCQIPTSFNKLKCNFTTGWRYLSQNSQINWYFNTDQDRGQVT